MNRNIVVNLLVKEHGVSWETAYQVAEANDFVYFLASGDLRDQVETFPEIAAPDFVVPVVSLNRKFLVNRSNGILSAGDECEVINIYRSSCMGNNETASIAVSRGGIQTRVTAQTISLLNILTASGDITLL